MDTTATTSGESRSQILDWSLAVGLTLFSWIQLTVVPLFITGGGPGPFERRGFPPPDVLFSVRVSTPSWWSYLLVALACLPLGARRRYPLQVLAAAVLFSSIYELTPNPPVLVALAPLIALYTVGTLLDRKALVRATLATVVFALVASLSHVSAARVLAEGVRITAMFAFAAALGDAARNRRAYITEVEQRAVEAEQSREEEALRRVEEERLRIARELHDVTAHSLSIIAVQAGAAERVIERDPEAAKRALATIRATSKSSLDELRAMLGVLRGKEDGAPLSPAGSLERLAELAASVEEAGVRVELLVEDLGDVPAFAELSVYRIVQEALTNVVRHARANVATVRIWRRDELLGIEVVDDGSAPSDSAGEGHGIAGMRERVMALGGSFAAGPRPNGGFRVAASIPLSGGAA